MSFDTILNFQINNLYMEKQSGFSILEDVKMKKCYHCKETKDFNEFYKNTYNKTGYQSRCKKCQLKGAKEIRNKNPEKFRKRTRNWNKMNPEQRKDTRLTYRYGISIEQFNEMREKQEFSCKICGIHESKLMKGLFVDHNHITGKVRGLLCAPCNGFLGKMKTDETLDLIIKLVDYCEKGLK